MKLCVLIPVKSFARAKQWLSSILTPREREALAEAMFRDVLEKTASSSAVSAIFVITADAKAAELASARGSCILPEESERGETEAVSIALGELKRRGAPSALVIPADIPLIRSDDLELLLECADDHAGGAGFGLLVPSRDHDGTNALLLSPPDLISPSFGKNSFSRHGSFLAARGAPYKIVENQNIGLDIDEAGDLETLLARPAAGRTRETLLGFPWARSQWGALGE